jgi:hypothetical protein
MPIKDPEIRRLYKAAWYLGNRDRLSVKKKSSYRADPLPTLSRNREWRRRQHSLYSIWCGMKRRCKNKNHNYGGRGITVCEEWRSSFEVFKTWALMNRWKRGLQIDRVDNNGNYEPGNCRFVTGRENSRNRRTNKLTLLDAVEIRKLRAHGELQKEIAAKYGVCRQMISNIDRNLAWSES